jgi:predicted RNA binding protein YcfA (HicA-like mRNA interferase family)
MSRLPRLKGKEVIRILERIGFRIIRTKGSHSFLKH